MSDKVKNLDQLSDEGVSVIFSIANGPSNSKTSVEFTLSDFDYRPLVGGFGDDLGKPLSVLFEFAVLPGYLSWSASLDGASVSGGEFGGSINDPMTQEFIADLIFKRLCKYFCRSYSIAVDGDDSGAWKDICILVRKKLSDSVYKGLQVSFADLSSALNNLSSAFVKPVDYFDFSKRLIGAAKEVENAISTLDIAKDTNQNVLVSCAEVNLERARNEMAYLMNEFDEISES